MQYSTQADEYLSGFWVDSKRLSGQISWKVAICNNHTIVQMMNKKKYNVALRHQI